MIRKLIVLVVAAISLVLVAAAVNPFLLFVPFIALGYYESPHDNSPFLEAHERAMRSFVQSKGFGFQRFGKPGFWNERSIHFEGHLYRPFRVSLIGLTPEHGDRYFEGYEMPRKADLAAAHSRQLSVEEAAAITQIRTGSTPWIKLPSASSDDVAEAIHVIAPVNARSSCLECHQVKEGTLLGGFVYEMTPIHEVISRED